jgi:hypothetical protein
MWRSILGSIGQRLQSLAPDNIEKFNQFVSVGVDVE